MKGLIYSQFFWPNNFRINDLAKHLGSSGACEITVLSQGAKYNIPEILDKNEREIYGRIPLVCIKGLDLRGSGLFKKISNLLFFLVGASWRLLLRSRTESDQFVLIHSTSPLISVLPAIIYCRYKRIPCILWVLDLWPETYNDLFNKSPLIFSILSRTSRYIQSNCDVLLASQGFHDVLVKRLSWSVVEKRFLPFENWAEDCFFQSARLRSDKSICNEKDEFVFLFAGNLGRAQNLHDLLEAFFSAAFSSEIGFKFMFIGTGVAKDYIRKLAENRGQKESVEFIDQVSVTKVVEYYAKADFAVVSLVDGVAMNRTIPGKVHSYMAFGLPVLVFGAKAVADLIEKVGCGVVMPGGSLEELKEVFLKVSKMDKKVVAQMGANGAIYAREHFTGLRAARQVADVLAEKVSRK